jgi:hypothetical protein
LSESLQRQITTADVLNVASRSPFKLKSGVSNRIIMKSAPVYTASTVASMLPFLLLFFNTDWFYDPVGWIDTYIFLGYFQHYLDPTFFPGDYKIGRLPWVLVGYAFNTLLPMIPAEIFLHVLCLSTATASMLFLVHRLFRNLALATFVSVALGFYFAFHGNPAGGWEYHNVPAGALFLILMLFLTRVGLSDVNKYRSTLVGIMTVLCVLTNPLLVNFLPLIFAYYFILRTATHTFATCRKELPSMLAWSAIGGLATIAILALVNFFSGRQLNFLENQLAFIGRKLHNNPAHVPFSHTWIDSATHLSIPAAVAVAGLATILIRAPSLRRLDFQGRLALLVIGLYIVGVLLWVFWQAAGQEALTPEYFFYPQIPLCFLALAGVLSLWGNGRFTPGAVFVGSVTAVAFIVPLSLVDLASPVKALIGWLTPSLFLQVAVVASIGLAAYLCGNGGRTAFVALAALMGLANSMTPWRSSYAYDSACKLNGEAFRAFAAATGAINRLSPIARNRRVWFEWGETFYPRPQCPMRVDYLAHSIAAANAYFFPTRPVPAPEGIPKEAVVQAGVLGLTILVITRDESNAIRLQKRFSDAGVALKAVGSEVIKSGPIEFKLLALRAGGVPWTPPSGGYTHSCTDIEGRESWLTANCRNERDESIRIRWPPTYTHRLPPTYTHRWPRARLRVDRR